MQLFQFLPSSLQRLIGRRPGTLDCFGSFVSERGVRRLWRLKVAAVSSTRRRSKMSMMASNYQKMRLEVAIVTIVLALVNFLMPVAAAFSPAEYADALEKSILFFDVQRSGQLPGWHRLNWRASSGLQDGHEDNVDLTGGYYDAGDNVKFGLPLAFTLTTLAWSVVEFGEQLRTAGQLGNALNALGWGTDYLLKASEVPDQLWAQVGDPYVDHTCWQRPEDIETERRAYKVDATRPGSDVAGETAAALAAASIALATYDAHYSSVLLDRAKRVFQFADQHRGNYRDAIASVVCPFYCSGNGYTDELLWGAAWLYKATGDKMYLDYIVANRDAFGGTTNSVHAFDWDSKYAGVQVLLAKFAMTGTQGLQGYKDRADNFICNVLPKSISPVSQVDVSEGGLSIFTGQANLQYVTAASLLLTIYSHYLANVQGVVNCGGGTIVNPAQLFAQARKQVDYILGANPRGMSYMIGFGANNPTHLHHRGGSIPSVRVQPEKLNCQQGSTYFNSGSPNPNQATGAIVGGPDQHDNIEDMRSNYNQMEPATYINAPVVGVLAVLATEPAT